MADKENNGDGRPANEPGVYKHPETGKELIARRHRKFGDAQADGYVQVGYKWVGPIPVEKKVTSAEAAAPKTDESKLTKKEDK